jgi:hypothetical protein
MDMYRTNGGRIPPPPPPPTPPTPHTLPRQGRIFIGRGKDVEASRAQQWDGSAGGQPEQATNAGGLYP